MQELMIKYQVAEASILEYLMNKYLNEDSDKLMNKPVHECLYPDKNYAKMLLNALEELKEILQKGFYSDLENVLKECIEDFSDCEESMAKIHGCMKSVIFDSFQRVNKSDVSALQDFLKQAGYQEINIHEGDFLEGNECVWQNAFPEDTLDSEKKGRIKIIHKQPYRISFWNGDEEETYVLQGLCTFYKKEMN